MVMPAPDYVDDLGQYLDGSWCPFALRRRRQHQHSARTQLYPPVPGGAPFPPPTRSGRPGRTCSATAEPWSTRRRAAPGAQLKLAVASTVNYFAPRLLAAFHRRYPGINLHLDVTNREALVRLLEANEADLVMMGHPPDNLRLETGPLWINPRW